jgi:hypothetical protein
MIENPFPGMNPFLERRWGDVHTRLVAYAGDLIQDELPSDLRARMQERVFIEGDDFVKRAMSPDVHVYERPASWAGTSPGGGDVAVAEPLIIHTPKIELTESYIEIIDAGSGGKVITVIEFVNRSNKAPGPGRDLYVRKQKDCQNAGVSLVEIDLLRGGRPVTLIVAEKLPEEAITTYHACVWRASKSLQLEYYPAPLRKRLPKIRIPLREKDADVPLDLQELINLSYRRGRYDDIDYTRPINPPLSPDEEAWMKSVLAHSGGA